MKLDFQDLLNKSKVLSIAELTTLVEKTVPLGFTSDILKTFKPNGFFRARPHNHLDGSLTGNSLHSFEHEGEFWNRPAKQIDEPGRCNDIGESLLYCSTDPVTAIIESKPSIGNYVSVSSFELRDTNIFIGSWVKFIGEQYLAQIPDIKHLFSAEDINRTQEFKEMDTFFDDLFHMEVNEENKHLYKLSVAVTKCMLKNLFDGKNQRLIDGMMYSSIERDKKSFNLIYRPEHARVHFVHRKVETYMVTDVNEKEIELVLKKTGYTIGQKNSPFENFKIAWLQGTNKTFKVLKHVHD
jgi:hypothetical protein